MPDPAGGAENLPFLVTNADTALVYATFWIEEVTPRSGSPFMQLEYAQFVILNFPAVLIPSTAPPPASDQGKLNLGWPHVSVATLRKTSAALQAGRHGGRWPLALASRTSTRWEACSAIAETRDATRRSAQTDDRRHDHRFAMVGAAQ